jgi:hypothetical protein
MGGFVHFFGDTNAERIKLGYTEGKTPKERREGYERGGIVPIDLHLLAAIRAESPRSVEQEILEHYKHLVVGNNGRQTETLRPEPEVVEYINWLRMQYPTWTDENEGPDEVPDPPTYMPRHGRREPLAVGDDPGKLVQDRDVTHSLAGTKWNRLVDSLPPYQDYYTVPILVDLAADAMGGWIDLDAASHWIAVREFRAFGIEVRDYFHQYKRAQDHPWVGNVWLNPPYGSNAQWFEMALRWFGNGIDQLCWLSPMWTFNTQIARPLMEKAAAMLVLTPTPKFWGRERARKNKETGELEEGRIIADPREAALGRNDPHAIVYLGPHRDRFLSVMRGWGDGLSIPASIDI